MKRILCAALVLLLLALTAAAEDQPFSLFPNAPDAVQTPEPDLPGEVPQDPLPTPVPLPPAEAYSEGSGQLIATIDGVNVTLDFYADPDYSYREGGYLTTCFSGEAAGRQYELYFVFPETILSGETVSDASCVVNGDEESGIMLFISTNDDERYAIASQYSDGAFPEGSSYTLDFTQADKGGEAWAFAGQMRATLIEVDATFMSVGTISIEGNFQLSAAFEEISDDGAQDEPGDYGDYGYDDPYQPFPYDFDYDAMPPTPPPYLTVPDYARKI